MKRAACLISVALALASHAQDKTKEWSGSQAGLKAVEAMKKLKGFHLEMEVDSVNYKGKYAGLAKGDGAAVSGTTEIWARKGQLLAKDRNGKIVPLNQLGANTDELKAARGFRNPADMLVEIETACNQARQEALDLEKLDGVECRKVQVDLRPAQKEAVIKEMFGGPGIGGVPIPNPESMLNIPETTVRYVIWMGTEDLRIRKISFEVKPVVKKGVPQGYGIPGMGGGIDPSQWTYQSSTRLLKHDEELDWKIPREVTQKLGLK
jgi:hypothetical protein